MRLVGSMVAVLSLVASPAFAQDIAAAEALFDKGLADMQAGRFDSGCPALAESHRIDPRPGTLFTLAECEAAWGRIATASARYTDYLRLFDRLTPEQKANQKGREVTSREKIAALAPDVPKLTLSLGPNAPPGTTVRRGEVTLGAASLGVPLPVDPGEHVVVIQPPGAPPTEQRVTIARGESKTVTLEVTAAPASATPPPGGTTTTPPSAPPADAGTDDGSTQRTVGFVVGGVGVAGIVVGAITGGLTLSKKSTIEDNCVELECNRDGKEAADEASTTGLVSTIGFAVGAAGLAAGVILVLTAPSPTAAAGSPGARFAAVITPTADGGRFALRGQF